MRVVSPSVTERIGNNKDNCKDNLSEDGSQPRAGFRHAGLRSVLPKLFFKLFTLSQLPSLAHSIPKIEHPRLDGRIAVSAAPGGPGFVPATAICPAIPSRTGTARRSRRRRGWGSQSRTPTEQHHQRRNPLRSNPLPLLMASSICSAIRTAFVLLL